MLLKEHLEEYTKDQLLEQARSFEIKKCSGTHFDSDLADKFVNMLQHDMLSKEIPRDLNNIMGELNQNIKSV